MPPIMSRHSILPLLLLWGACGQWAAGQAIRTPARTSWVGDSSTTVAVTWDRPVEGRGTVRYGLTTNYAWVRHNGGGVYRHVVHLDGLEPDTRYYYEASSTDGYSQEGTFRTAPRPGQPLHFAIHGDLYGSVNEAAATEVANLIVAEDPQFVVNLGDMAFESFTDTGFSTWGPFFRTCSNLLANAVFMPTMGNHDGAPGKDYVRATYQRLFELPEPSLGNAHYSFGAGSARFISLNTDKPAVEQNEWLERELQAAVNDPDVVWVFTTTHRPPYSWGFRPGDEEYQEHWPPILTRYETDWMVSGHSHNYQRTVPIDGVNYMVAGGGGGALYESAVGEPMHLFATTCYHHVSVRIEGDLMRLEAIRSDGRVFDTAAVTNRRHVRVEPAFPVRGERAKILYRAEGGPLAGANPVHVHLGQDEFAGAFASAPMAWNAQSQRWEYEFTVPTTATQRLAFAFRDHGGAATNWHNNHGRDWQALLDRAHFDPPRPPADGTAVLRYDADMGPLAAATAISAWISYNGGQFPAGTPVALAKGPGSRWEAAVAIPPHARDATVFFYGGNLRDDNVLRKWTFAVARSTAPAPLRASAPARLFAIGEAP